MKVEFRDFAGRSGDAVPISSAVGVVARRWLDGGQIEQLSGQVEHLETMLGMLLQRLAEKNIFDEADISIVLGLCEPDRVIADKVDKI